MIYILTILKRCDYIYDEGKRQGIDLPMFYRNMDWIKAELG